MSLPNQPVFTFACLLLTSISSCSAEGSPDQSNAALTYFPPPDASGGWRNATNAAQTRERAGMDLRRLEQAWDFTQRCTQNGGLLVVRNGWLVFERYFGRASRSEEHTSELQSHLNLVCRLLLE